VFARNAEKYVERKGVGEGSKKKYFWSRRPESREDFARALPSVTNHGQEPQTSTNRSLFLPSAFDLGEATVKKSSSGKGLSTFTLFGCVSPCPRNVCNH